MIKKMLVTLTYLILVLGIASASLAASTQTVTIRASVPTSNGMTVSITKSGGTETMLAAAAAAPTDGVMMDFGTLTLDTVNHIYVAADYFAVDIGVENSGGWTIQHTPSSVFNRTTGNTAQNLDNHINVSFMQQLNDTQANPLSKVSFANSTKTITNADVGTGWIRIYYGIGTGSGDNSGVSPIGQTQAAGAYQGSVTITLSP